MYLFFLGYFLEHGNVSKQFGWLTLKLKIRNFNEDEEGKYKKRVVITRPSLKKDMSLRVEFYLGFLDCWCALNY